MRFDFLVVKSVFFAKKIPYEISSVDEGWFVAVGNGNDFAVDFYGSVSWQPYCNRQFSAIGGLWWWTTAGRWGKFLTCSHHE
jgi:hypothetical protein